MVAIRVLTQRILGPNTLYVHRDSTDGDTLDANSQKHAE